MYALSSIGAVFEITEIKEYPKKTIITMVWRNFKIIVTRYSCANYYVELPNGMRTRVKMRKWFPEWWWRT